MTSRASSRSTTACPPMTCVLGYAGERCPLSPGAKWYDTRIGGIPIWPEEPSPEVPPCPRCEHDRFLIIQAYAPHSVHPYRSILLFACNDIKCSIHEDTWLAICVIEVKPEKKTAEPVQTGESHRSKEANNADDIDWDNDDESDESDDDLFNIRSGQISDDGLVSDLEQLSLKLENSHVCSSQSNNGSISTTNKRNVTEPMSSSKSNCSQQPQVSEKDSESIVIETKDGSETSSFPCFYVDVEYENSSTSDQSAARGCDVEALLAKYLEEEKSSTTRGGVGGSKLETWATEGEEERGEKEKAFDLYSRTIARSPEQILRYAFGSERHLIWPSVPSPLESVGQMQCHSCKGRIVFEFQILASSLYYLNPDACVKKDQKNAGLNFATVAVFTCANDCGGNVCSNDPHFICRTERFHAFSMKAVIMQDDW